MNKELWDKIAAFNFDDPPSEYGFSTRLANENYWTKDFTQQAIIEYKKFMYLAASSDFMVSPSEIVDIVWHQHLIFTQSYQDFCKLIDKQVQHIPSTHNKEEAQKFKQAKERTLKLYEMSFGKQPIAIWGYSGMYESLRLTKARFKLRSFIICGILSFLILVVPFYFLLRPLYLEIDNPFFMLGFIGISGVSFIALELYNEKKLRHITSVFDKNSFIYNLQPYELIYMQDQDLSHVINGTVNELIDLKLIRVNADYSIEPSTTKTSISPEQQQVVTLLGEVKKTFYPVLLRKLVTKPIFWNTANSMDAFKKYFNKSQKFGELFYFNFGILSLVLMIGFIRMTTGALRDKPIWQIFIGLVILTAMIIAYLNRLTKLINTQTIPELYRKEILPNRKMDTSWQWRYFLLGTAVLTTSFVPLVNHVEKTTSSGSNCGTSCGSSCGSSCSSCGGCGGD